MDDFSKKALQCHNECREQHQVPPLTWAADLACEAQEWANKIARANHLQHASQSERKNAGENIAMFSGRFDTAAEQATGMWYNEVEKYNFEKPSSQPGTGHFTQFNQEILTRVFLECKLGYQVFGAVILACMQAIDNIPSTWEQRRQEVHQRRSTLIPLFV